MILPTIHLNGTSREELREQVRCAHEAANDLRQALMEMTPNGRDYYPQGKDAIHVAVLEHTARIVRVDQNSPRPGSPRRAHLRGRAMKREELQAALEAAVAENDRLRAALQDALDLAWEDAPAMMVVDVCDRALSVERPPNDDTRQYNPP